MLSLGQPWKGLSPVGLHVVNEIGFGLHFSFVNFLSSRLLCCKVDYNKDHSILPLRVYRREESYWLMPEWMLKM
jgi:hypothetical protein